MKPLFRYLTAGVAAVATFYFVFWVSAAVLLTTSPQPWLAIIDAALLGIIAVAIVLRQFRSATRVDSPVLTAALVTGATGFASGFFGPLIFMDSNQGPLLGIFVTGPIGVVLGAMGGAAYSAIQRRRTRQSSARSGLRDPQQ
jgi:hypothetical protein